MTESAIPPKIKFKKRTLKKKRLRRTDDDGAAAKSAADAGGGAKASHEVEDNATNTAPNGDGDSDEDGPSALAAILAADRRRKLFGRSRGIDAAALAKATKKEVTSKNEEDNAEEAPNKDLEERLQLSFAGGKLAGSNDMGGDEEGGVVAKKHRKAMEEFIRQNLNEAEGGANQAGSEKETKAAASEEQKELYAELLAEKEGEPAAEGEGDVGAGGAMMGGTGIAEVALPIDERLKALKATERAAAEYERARRMRFGTGGGEEDGLGLGSAAKEVAAEGEAAMLAGRVPRGFAAGPAKRKRPDVDLIPVDHPTSKIAAPHPAPPIVSDHPVASSALPRPSASSAGLVQTSDVSTLGASYSHNFKLHTHEWVARRRDERQSELDALHAEEAEGGPPASQARLGFAAARKLAKGELTAPAGAARASGGEGGRNEWDKGSGEKRSSDERVWKTFMSKQRNRR